MNPYGDTYPDKTPVPDGRLAVPMTALDKPADQLRGFAFGADAYLTKPFSMAELLHTIALLLNETQPH